MSKKKTYKVNLTGSDGKEYVHPWSNVMRKNDDGRVLTRNTGKINAVYWLFEDEIKAKLKTRLTDYLKDRKKLFRYSWLYDIYVFQGYFRYEIGQVIRELDHEGAFTHVNRGWYTSNLYEGDQSAE